MTSTNPNKAGPRVWTGRILSGLVIVFLLMDAVMKLMAIEPVISTMRDLGFNSTPALARAVGILLLACTVLYAIPRTAVLGAVLLTGYLGGAMAIHLRAGSPLLTHLLFGAYLGAMMWAGLLLRDKKISAVLFART